MPEFNTNNKSIRELYQNNIDGILKPKPDYQRHFVWKLSYKRSLIETIIKGFPIPQIFLRSKVNNDNCFKNILEVVDGQQRLKTIFAFLAGEFKISTDDKKIENKKFNELSEIDKNNLLNYNISIINLIDIDDVTTRIMFAKMNSNVMPLNQQEVRFAKYYGEFAVLIQTISFNEKINRELLNLKIISNSDIKRRGLEELICIVYLFLSNDKKAIDINKSVLDQLYENENDRHMIDICEYTTKIETLLTEVITCIKLIEILPKGKFYFNLVVLLILKNRGVKNEMAYKKILALSKKIKIGILNIRKDVNLLKVFKPLHTRKAQSWNESIDILIRNWNA